MSDDFSPVARPVRHERSIDNWRSRPGAPPLDVRRRILDSRAIPRPVIRTSAINLAIDNGVGVVCHGSLDRSLDCIRHEGVVVHRSPISRPLDRLLHDVGHDRIIVILT